MSMKKRSFPVLSLLLLAKLLLLFVAVYGVVVVLAFIGFLPLLLSLL